MLMNAASETVIWDPAEQLPRAELRELQRVRLRAMFGVELDALAQEPFSGKAELRDGYPFGLLRVPVSSLVRLHASSGTHGKPTVVGYTRADLEAWTELMARCMTLAGVRPGMLVHNANTYGLFTGGHGFHQGAERIGAPVVPVSGGMSARQAMLLDDLGAQVLVSTPSYALVIAQAVKDAGIDPATLKLELGLFGGEPWTEGLRTQLESALPGLRAVNFYGLSEMCGPGVAAECIEARDGLHVHEDHFLVEVVDPESGRVLPEGEEGEFVFTTLAKEAMPFLRYRTGDIGSLTLRALQLRQDDGEDPRPTRPPRRHDHRPRRQRVSLERRACAPLGARGSAALPAHPRAGRRDGRAHGSMRACSRRDRSGKPTERRRTGTTRTARHTRSRRSAGHRCSSAK